MKRSLQTKDCLLSKTYGRLVPGGIVFLVFLFLFITIARATSVQAAAPKLNKTQVTLTAGKKFQLKVSGAKKVNWNPNGYNSEEYTTDVAKTSNKGLVTAVHPGIVTVFVKADGKMLSCDIIVKPTRYALTVKKKTNSIQVSNKKFSLTLPSAWKKYAFYIIGDEGCYSFASKTNFDVGYYGTVFSICTATKSEWKTLKEELPNYTYLGKKNNTVYYLARPTDVAYNYENKKCRTAYLALDKTMNQITSSFKIK